jgi:mRNA-degrading endonuclease HigB of HigAB toxin-antitoxin module
MPTPTHIAQHLRAVHFGGNWTAVNLKDTLQDVDWQQATTQVFGFNTIAVLVFHMNYYVVAATKVLQGGPLDAHDKYSFDLPPLQSQEDWQLLQDKTWNEAEALAQLIELLPASKLDETFVLEKYGNYYRNLHGVIEHVHYHLGQIVLLKKLMAQTK